MVQTFRVSVRRALAAIFLVPLVAACTATGTPAPPSSLVGGAEAAAGIETRSETIDGLDRTWLTYTPPGIRGGQVPTVVVIHGTGDSGAGIRSAIGPELERLAEAEGFRLIYVDGFQGNWNECRAEGRWPAKDLRLDDVGVVREAVEASGSAGPVFVVGFSSGGHMAMRLALEAPDLVAGVAPVAASPPVVGNQTCDTAGAPVPVMFVEGREDRINPVDGGEVVVGSGRSAVSRGDVLSAADGAAWFARHNGLDTDGTPAPLRSGAANTWTWEGEDPVRLVVVDGVGHSFPTASAGYDAPGEIWDFFSGLTS